MSPQVKPAKPTPIEQLILRFADLQDSRVQRTKLPQLLDIVTIAICSHMWSRRLVRDRASATPNGSSQGQHIDAGVLRRDCIGCWT